MSDHWTDDRIDHVYGAGTIGAKWVRDLRDERDLWQSRAEGAIFALMQAKPEMLAGDMVEWIAALSREHAQPAQVVNADGLLPCPFCGDEPKIEHDGLGGTSIWCDNEDCMVQVEYTHHVGESEAVAAWNRRLTPPAQEGAGAVEVELLGMIDQLLTLTHTPDHNWEENDYVLRDSIDKRCEELKKNVSQTKI